MLVEICANSFRSAQNAQNAGADRIELCSELAVGGITPSYGLISHVLNKLNIPTHILIRPRGGDFCYNNDDFEIMKQDIEMCKSLGAKGIVSGVLNPDFSIDIDRTITLINLSRPMNFTFHRAFDLVSNPFKGLKQLEKMGVSRVLTSGQAPTAIEGLSLLKTLQNDFKGIIIPSAGINCENIKQFKLSGFKEIHFSASVQQPKKFKQNLPLNSIKDFDETTQTYTDTLLVTQMISLLHE
ncbi:MAG: copper homeostasis protein CutC [Bacteroidia bacterium]